MQRLIWHKLLTVGILLIGMLLIGVFTAPSYASGSTFEVNNDNDSGIGSLRQAIMDANETAGHDTIEFDIDGEGMHVIRVQSVLPAITDPVTIDGTSQDGYDEDTGPVIEISGIDLNLEPPGLDTLCKGPAAGRYRDYPGLDVRKDPDSSVDASGTTILGLKISDFCQGISVSGTVGLRDNGTAYGCEDVDGDPPDLLAVDYNDSIYLANKIFNITVKDSHIVGSDQGNAGLDLCNAQYSLLQGNYLDNESDNMEVAHSEFVTVIDNTAHGGKDGVSLVESYFVTVRENHFIGTGTGAHMKFSSAYNQVLDNVITNVKRFGLAVTDNNLIKGNTITGSGWFGIEIRGGSNNMVENNTVISNGFSSDDPNFAGIVVGAASRRGVGFPGNCTDMSGNPAKCRESDGDLFEWDPLRQESSVNNTIRNNEIAFNNGPGILVGGRFNEWISPSGVPDDQWDHLTKAFLGDQVYSAYNNSLRGNLIYGNQGLGIDLSDKVQFLFHSVGKPFDPPFNEYGIVELQVALPDGPTANDSAILANGGQNFPVLTSALAAPGQLVVRGTIDTPNPQFATIEFFANSAGDPSGHGEGSVYLGAVTPNSIGKFTAPLPPVPAGTLITATATDAAGSTSEFAANVVATSP